MATYRPSFVDVSGLTSGINRGLQIAAQLKRQQDQLAEARIDEFMRMYQPGKLRQLDIPDFTNAYTNYKNAALNYSRTNRGGGKPEVLAQSKAEMDRALSGLNEVYNKSTSAAAKQAEYADYMRMARSKGFDIPNEVTAYVNTLSSAPISNLDIANIPSAYQFDLVPKEIDWDGLSKTLDNTGARLKDITTERSRIQYGVDVNGKPIFAEAVTKYSGRDPLSTVEIVRRLGQSNPKISNSAKEDYKLLLQGLQNGSPSSIERFNEIRTYFPGIKSANDLLPEMVFSLPLYRRQSQGTTIDKSMAEQQYRLARDVQNINLRRQQIAATAAARSKPDEEVLPQSHPYFSIEAIKETYKNSKKPNEDVSDIMKSYTLPGGLTSKEIIESAFYDPKNDIFTVKTVNGQPVKLKASALENQIVESSGEYKARKMLPKPRSGGGRQYIRLDKDGNPIYN